MVKQKLKKKTIIPFKKNKKKYNKREILALIFALAAVSFFILNSIYFLTEKDTIKKNVETIGDSELNKILPPLIIFLSIIWILFSILFSFIIYLIEKKKVNWYILLIVSILALFTFRIDSSILGIIASILYMKEHK